MEDVRTIDGDAGAVIGGGDVVGNVLKVKGVGGGVSVGSSSGSGCQVEIVLDGCGWDNVEAVTEGGGRGCFGGGASGGHGGWVGTVVAIGRGHGDVIILLSK